jgi:hypothetical protein
MPLCIVLIALMYLILRDPCPCDEEDKNNVVEGLTKLDYFLIILVVVMCYKIYKNAKSIKELLFPPKPTSNKQGIKIYYNI